MVARIQDQGFIYVYIYTKQRVKKTRRENRMLKEESKGDNRRRCRQKVKGQVTRENQLKIRNILFSLFLISLTFIF